MSNFLLGSVTILLSFCGFSQCTSSGTSLATLYNSDNSNKGVMFNIVATNTITVICFDANMIGFSTGTFEIYYKVGTYVGSQSNAAAWTMIGSNSITATGTNNPTPMNIPLNIVIPAGQTYGFYITNNDPGIPAGVRYTNGTSATLASDANVSIVGGIGKAYPFAADYANRRFNGTLYYALGNVLPVEMTAFHATPVERKVKLTWSTETETNSDYFGIERSSDTYTWELIGKVNASGTTSTRTDYSFMDENPLTGISYYRLSQTDNNGDKEYFDVVSIERYSVQQGELSVFPNPATDIITINGSEDELGEVELFDLTGRNLTNEVTFANENNTLTIDLSSLDQDVIIVRSGDRYSLVMKE